MRRIRVALSRAGAFTQVKFLINRYIPELNYSFIHFSQKFYMMRSSSSLSVFKYPLQARNKDAHREELFVFLCKVEKKLYVQLIRITLKR